MVQSKFPYDKIILSKPPSSRLKPSHLPLSADFSIVPECARIHHLFRGFHKNVETLPRSGMLRAIAVSYFMALVNVLHIRDGDGMLDGIRFHDEGLRINPKRAAFLIPSLKSAETAQGSCRPEDQLCALSHIRILRCLPVKDCHLAAGRIGTPQPPGARRLNLLE